MVDMPDWIDKSEEEIEEIIVNLAEEKDKSPSEIGNILRDKYGIPNVSEVLGKNMLEVLVDNGVEPDIPEDLMEQLKDAVNLDNHLDQNPNDVESQRALSELESKIQKLSKYYRRKGRLPEDWRYDPERAALLVQS